MWGCDLLTKNTFVTSPEVEPWRSLHCTYLKCSTVPVLYRSRLWPKPSHYPSLWYVLPLANWGRPMSINLGKMCECAVDYLHGRVWWIHYLRVRSWPRVIVYGRVLGSCCPDDTLIVFYFFMKISKILISVQCRSFVSCRHPGSCLCTFSPPLTPTHWERALNFARHCSWLEGNAEERENICDWFHQTSCFDATVNVAIWDLCGFLESYPRRQIAQSSRIKDCHCYVAVGCCCTLPAQSPLTASEERG